jgi:hypothetical protein
VANPPATAVAVAASSPRLPQPAPLAYHTSLTTPLSYHTSLTTPLGCATCTAWQVIWFLETSACLCVIFPLVAHTLSFSKPPGLLKLAVLTVLSSGVTPLAITLLNACDDETWPVEFLGVDSFWDNVAMIHNNPIMLVPVMALCAAATADVMSDNGLLRSPLLRATLLLVCVVWFLLEVCVWKDIFAGYMGIWAFPVAAITMPFLLQPSVVLSERGTDALLDGVVGRTLLWLAPYSTGFYAWQVTSHHITSHHITSHHITYLTGFDAWQVPRPLM